MNLTTEVCDVAEYNDMLHFPRSYLRLLWVPHCKLDSQLHLDQDRVCTQRNCAYSFPAHSVSQPEMALGSCYMSHWVHPITICGCSNRVLLGAISAQENGMEEGIRFLSLSTAFPFWFGFHKIEFSEWNLQDRSVWTHRGPGEKPHWF